MKQNHGTKFQPSTWLEDREEDDETDDDEDIEVDEELLGANLPPMLRELKKLEDGSVEQNQRSLSKEEILSIFASVNLFREVKIGPVNWRLILDCTGVSKSTFCDACTCTWLYWKDGTIFLSAW